MTEASASIFLCVYSSYGLRYFSERLGGNEGVSEFLFKALEWVTVRVVAKAPEGDK